MENTIDLSKEMIPPHILTKIPYKQAQRFSVIPIDFDEEDNVLSVLMPDCNDIEIKDDLARLTGCTILPVQGDKNEIDTAIQRLYLSKIDNGFSNDNVAASNGDSIIKVVNSIINNAIKKRASDIHIEAYEKEVKLRYRIDGILYDSPPPPIEQLKPIVSRIKVMANLNIAEKRLPQDGKVRFEIAGKHLDMRISIIPTIYGESAVIRILDKDSVLLGMERLGFFPDTLEQMQQLISHSHGLILVSGPTGSGKTTTLYSALSHLNTSAKKIITIEDPVEYDMLGTQQIQVKPKITLTFAAGLRSVLRHDPDIVLVGEIRDPETAKIAIQSALTGHLVFSTLHTNDAPSSVARLLDMGIENYLVSSSLIGVLAQRLVRLICPKCKYEYKQDIKLLKIPQDSIKKFYKGKGCNYCNNIGYRGRTAIFELMQVNDDIRQCIMKSSSASEIKKEAVKNGLVTLFDYGLKKVNESVTTIDEVLRVCTK